MPRHIITRLKDFVSGLRQKKITAVAASTTAVNQPKKRRFKIDKEKVRLHYKKHSRWYYFLVPTTILAIYGYDRFYASRVACLDKLQKIFNYPDDNGNLRIKVNKELALLNPLFPCDPAAILYPRSVGELEIMMETIALDNMAVFVTSQEQLNKPPGLGCVFRDYCLVNLKHLKGVTFDQQRNRVVAETGITSGALDQILKARGYKPLFLEELHDKMLVDVINYNLPMPFGGISKSTVSLDLFDSSGMVTKSAAEGRQLGIAPVFNDLFIGSCGAYSLPVRITLQLQKRHAPIEALKLELPHSEPSEVVRRIKQVIKCAKNAPRIQFKMRKLGQGVVVEFESRGIYPLKEVLKDLLSDPAIRRVGEQGKTYNTSNTTQQSEKSKIQTGIFSISQPNLGKFIVESSLLKNVTWQYQSQVLKVRGSWQDLLLINNWVAQNSQSFLWCSNAEEFERLKLQNQSSKYQDLVVRKSALAAFLDPAGRFLSASYANS